MNTIRTIRELLKDCYGTSAHLEVLKHAEADTLIQAFNKNIQAKSAVMFVDRKICGWCAGKSFSGGSIRRLFPLIGLQVLEIWTPDDNGLIGKLTIYAPESNRKNTFN